MKSSTPPSKRSDGPRDSRCFCSSTSLMPIVHIFLPRNFWNVSVLVPRTFRTCSTKSPENAAPTESRETQEIIDLYDAEVAFADEQLGRFFDELKKSSLYDNTLIILTADHGEAFYEHGHWEHSQTLYEEIIRVPLIAKWPGNTPKERRSSMVGEVDIFPTLLEAAGVAAPPTGAVSLLRGGLALELRSDSHHERSDVVVS